MKGVNMVKRAGVQLLPIFLAALVAALAVPKILVISGSAEAATSSTDLTFSPPTSTSQFSNCGYNVKTCANKSRYHTGIDYRGSSAGTTPANASNYGVVARLEKMNISDCGLGNNIILEHELSSGAKIYTSYSHLASIAAGLKVGDFVLKGQTLGIVGRSGNGNANAWDDTHVHFEVKTKAVSSNPSGSGSYCGYTPANPTDYGYKDPQLYLGIQSVKQPVAIILTAPLSGEFRRGGSMSVTWSTLGAKTTDKISISIKRDSYATLQFPDGVNFVRFTETELNDGAYSANIPIAIALSSDWRVYVKLVASGKYDSSDSPLTATR
ncbi:MAG: hypothetical protein QOF89_4797 [Acidobacteriota bacterium]|jgi:hypothetical protein|nr:hypothetical protein [Acidobacteriota bacterium]